MIHSKCALHKFSKKAKYYSRHNEVSVVRQYIIEPQLGSLYRPEQPFSNTRNIMVFESGSSGAGIPSSSSQTRITSLTTIGTNKTFVEYAIYNVILCD